VLKRAQKIWREKNLEGLDQIENPVDKVRKLLENYRDRYMRDTVHFPGGCVFVTLSVELDDQRPNLSREINRGFQGLKNMLKGFLDEAKASGNLLEDVDTEALSEMIFAGVLGASVLYGTEKSYESLNRSIVSLINTIERLRR
jgi:hypothetical protein